MRYSKEHKAETHARIVSKAAVRLRENGLHGVGVADLMKEAGLTHGGFYAHFDSRDALVIEAFSHAMDRATASLSKIANQDTSDKRLAAIVDRYLTPLHRDTPGRGCAVPALGADVARESVKTRRAFAAKLEEMVDAIAVRIADDDDADARRQAIGAMSTMVGALILSRVAGSGSLSDDILSVGRKAAVLATGRTAVKTSGRRPRTAADARVTARKPQGSHPR